MVRYTLQEEQMLEDLRGLLKIKSVNGECGEVTAQAPLGEGVYDAIEYMLSLGRKFGFRTKNVDGYCGWIEMGEGERMVAVVGHLDTVAADSGWSFEPFDGTIADGRLYGRGTSDDKGPSLVALYAMKALADSKVPLGKRVRLILGGDEEAGGWRCMRRYKQTEELPACAFTPDSEYPVTYAEKAILHIRMTKKLENDVTPIFLEGGNTINVVPAAAKAVVNGVEYTQTGKAAHAMEPQKGVNAVIKLCETLRGQGIAHPFLELAAMANPEGLSIAFSDQMSGELTINPSIARVSEAEASLSCDLRIPVTVQKDTVLNAIKAAVLPLGFEVSVLHYLPPLFVDPKSALVTTLQKVYLDCSGRDTPPAAIGGGTYARAFDNAVAFGALFEGEEVSYHKPNEYWSLDSIRKNFQIMANAIAAL